MQCNKDEAMSPRSKAEVWHVPLENGGPSLWDQSARPVRAKAELCKTVIRGSRDIDSGDIVHQMFQAI